MLVELLLFQLLFLPGPPGTLLAVESGQTGDLALSHLEPSLPPPPPTKALPVLSAVSHPSTEPPVMLEPQLPLVHRSLLLGHFGTSVRRMVSGKPN